MAAKKQPWPPERVFVQVRDYGSIPARGLGSVYASQAQADQVTSIDRKLMPGIKVDVHEYRLVHTKSALDDPNEDRAFYDLADAIDQHLGWRNDREREAGDYVARIKQVGAVLKALGTPEHLRSSTQQLAVAIVTAGQRVMMLGQAEPRENGLRVAGKVGRAVKAKRAKARKRKAVR